MLLPPNRRSAAFGLVAGRLTIPSYEHGIRNRTHRSQAGLPSHLSFFFRHSLQLRVSDISLAFHRRIHQKQGWGVIPTRVLPAFSGLPVLGGGVSSQQSTEAGSPGLWAPGSEACSAGAGGTGLHDSVVPGPG
jgi:hypothetical protein